MHHFRSQTLGSSPAKGFLPLAVLGALLLIAPYPAHAQTFVDGQKAGEVHTGSLIGAQIVNDAGETIGNVNYLVLDDNGKATTLVLGVGGVLGVGEKNVGVPFEEVVFTDTPDGKRQGKFKATKDQLVAAPTYKWLNTPLAVKVEDTIKETAKTIKEVGKKAQEAVDDAAKSVEDAAKSSEAEKPSLTPAP